MTIFRAVQKRSDVVPHCPHQIGHQRIGCPPPKTHDKIIEHFGQLEGNPRLFGAEKLTGYNAYKLSVGNIRIIYEIDDSAKEIRVSMVDDRKEMYKRLRRKK